MIIDGYKIIAEGDNWITQKPNIEYFVKRLSMGCRQTVDDYQEVSNEFKEIWESEHKSEEPEELIEEEKDNP